MSDLEILKLLIEEFEMQKTHLRPTKSYGAGHPWTEKQSVKQVLGTSMYPDEEEVEQVEEPKKVKVSKAFRN
jgi:hypothetical protein